MNLLRRLRVLSLIIFAALLVLGWGAQIHKVVNGNMVLHLPVELTGFINKAQLFIDSSSVPDWRKYGNVSTGYPIDPNEPDHFIDIDYYPEFATHSVSTNLDSLILKHGRSVVYLQGIVPWVIVWQTDSLAAQMQRGAWTNVWSTAACLGHYVGDIHQPLHATKNYNGQLTGQTGIHSRYETQMFTTSVLASITVTPASVSNISNPIAYIFDRVYESNFYVDSILSADIYARSLDASYGNTYKAALWQKTKYFTQLQIQRATQTYANLIYTAWLKAGSPNIPTSVEKFQSSNPQAYNLQQNFPNPFNPRTTIQFDVAQSGMVKLTILSMEGKEIASLVNTNLEEGTYSVNWDAGSYSSGIYFYRIETKDFSQTKKLVYLK